MAMRWVVVSAYRATCVAFGRLAAWVAARGNNNNKQQCSRTKKEEEEYNTVGCCIKMMIVDNYNKNAMMILKACTLV